MKRKILSILLALCLALTLLPVAAFATEDGGAAPAEPQQEQQEVVDPEVKQEVKQEADPEQQPEEPEGQPEQPEAKPEEEKDAQEKQEEPAPQPAQSEGEPVVLNGEGENGTVTWTEIGQDDTEQLKTSGYYRLTENIDNLDALDIGPTSAGATITLDLNGHTLTGTNESLYTLWINQNTTLTIIDRSTSGGGSVVSPNGTAVKVYANAVFTLESGNISGNVVVGTGDTSDDATTAFTMDGGSITGGLTADGKTTINLNDGTVGGIWLENNSTLYANGGTVTGSCTIYGTVLQQDNTEGTVFEGTVTGTLGGEKITGLGTKNSPYELTTAAELKAFRDYVNSATAQSRTNSACAELTADIDLKNEEWTPIGKNLSAGVGQYPYTGTFDGKGHTIKNLNVNSETFAGLFGYVCGGTIKNLTVAGNVSTTTSSGAGGIAGGADGGTFENCANLCDVQGGIAGGIIGFANNINYELIVRDCYNVGSITSTTNNSVGGIIGQNTSIAAPSTISNCYNAGNVTGPRGVGAIVGTGGSTAISNCYYLEGSAIRAGNGDKKSTPKSAKEFADGTVLALLKAGERGSNADPWDDTCQYVTAAGKTLPVFKGQGDAHSHTWGEWTSNGDGTHTRACACGVTETGKCSGGTATRTARAVCQFCGQPYGQLASGGGIRRQPTGGSGAANTSGTTKTVKSGNTGDMGVMLYAGMALLSLTGGAWIVGKKRK